MGSQPRIGNPDKKPLVVSSFTIPLERLSPEQRGEIEQENRLARERATEMTAEQVAAEEVEKRRLLADLRANRAPKKAQPAPEALVTVPEPVLDAAGHETIASMRLRVERIKNGLYQLWTAHQLTLRDYGRTCASHPEVQVRSRLAVVFAQAQELHEDLRIAIVESERAMRALDVAIAANGGADKRAFDKEFATTQATIALHHDPVELKKKIEACLAEIEQLRADVAYPGQRRGSYPTPEIIVTLGPPPQRQTHASGMGFGSEI